MKEMNCRIIKTCRVRKTRKQKTLPAPARKSSIADIVTYDDRERIDSTYHRSHIQTVSQKSKDIVIDYRLRVYRDIVSKASMSDLGARYRYCFWTKTKTHINKPTAWQKDMKSVLEHLSKVQVV